MAIRRDRTLRGALDRYPFLKKDPMYDPKRFPDAFEENMLMACKRNHLNPERINLEDPYVMDGCVKNIQGKLMFYYDVEYSKVENLINSENKFKYPNVHIPLEKITYFMKHNPSFYIRGNVEKVLVLRDIAICEAYSKGKIERDVLCSHGSVKKVQVLRDFIRVPVKTAVKKGRLKIGPLKDWLKMINQMPLLDLWLV